MRPMTPEEISQAFDDNQQSSGPPATAWIPATAGDTLLGYVARRNIREGDFGPYTVITVITEQAELLALHCSGSALNGNLDNGGDWPGLIAERDPHLGDYIGFRYDGQSEPRKRGQQGTKRWTMFVKRGPFKEYDALLDRAANTIADDPKADEYAVRWARERIANTTELGSDDPFNEDD